MTDQEKIEMLRGGLMYVAEELDRAVIMFKQRGQPKRGQQCSPSLDTIQLGAPSAARNAERLVESIMHLLTETE